ncbi:hypothetical protein [Pseudoalteromonas lipolytica]|uniref:hypothetical protein n=1 Tax=Pseudoalteromonas lipolytica TaxID=570156 RepID=UPI0008248906|nr:hypothetical protein [Pseudoalteromonas lipolytica]
MNNKTENSKSLSSLFFHFEYYLKGDHTLETLPVNKPFLKLASVCLLDRSLFWKASRHYSNTSLLQLKNIIRAEKKQLPPMEGEFFWSLKQVTANSLSVDYFVVPLEVMSQIPKQVKMILPLQENEEEQLPLTLDQAKLNHASPTSQLDELNWFNLLGLFVKKQAKQKVKERLSTRNLLISLFAFSLVLAVMISGYFAVALKHFEDKKVNNVEAVNKVINQRQALNNEFKEFSDINEFLIKNPNVLSKLSLLGIDSEGILFERIKVTTQGVELYGNSESSATNLLQQIIASPSVKEAKFSRPVVKNNKGYDVFTIEVVWR